MMLNRITGKTTVVPESGVRVSNGLTHRLYVLDKTLQTLEMTGTIGQGDRSARDDIKSKTSDGSDVYVDLKVQCRIIIGEADTVLSTSGPKHAFKEKWARDYVRSASRNFLGELTSEGFYDASKRNGQVVEALADLRERLLPFGIQIDSIVLPTRPRFYEEYETMIKKKKLADQQALEEESKAEAAKQRQRTEVVEATNKKNVAVEEFTGQMQQLVIEAEAEAEKTRQETDAYFDRVTIGAEAGLYQKRLEAEGILARK